MTVAEILARLNNCASDLDVCVQVNGGAMDFELTIEEYPAVSPTEVRITANGETKSQVDDVIADLGSLSGSLPVMARVADGPWALVSTVITIPDLEDSTDVLIVAFEEDID